MDRISVDLYFLKIAMVVAERSTCHRHHVGAVSVRGKQLLTTGYNGAPAGMADCLELGCLREGIPSGERTEICRAVHAEENAIIQGSLHGISIEGATIYCTLSPCRRCAKMLCNARIARFVTFNTVYGESVFADVFGEAGIEFVVVDRPATEITVLP